MSTRPIAALALLLVPMGCAGPIPVGSPDADEIPRAGEGVLYAMGTTVGQQIKDYQLDDTELREFARGMSDAAQHRPYAGAKLEGVADQIAQFQRRRLVALANREERAGSFVLEQAANVPGAVKKDSGIVVKVIEPGSGEPATIFDFVKVNYHGTLRDGSVFWSNRDGQEPWRGQFGTMSPCWQDGFEGLAAGARLHVACPPAKFMWSGWLGLAPGSVVSFDLELVSIERQKPPSNYKPG
jgi:FKBP-type peptidyl-prolyl cis-trans isomerase